MQYLLDWIMSDEREMEERKQANTTGTPAEDREEERGDLQRKERRNTFKGK